MEQKKWEIRLWEFLIHLFFCNAPSDHPAEIVFVKIRQKKIKPSPPPPLVCAQNRKAWNCVFFNTLDRFISRRGKRKERTR
jgi:hypothetical protein